MLTLELKNQLMYLTHVYTCEMISEVLDVPLLWVKSAELEKCKYSSKARKKIYRELSSKTSMKNKIKKLRKASKMIEQTNFYRDDLVMQYLDRSAI